MTTAFVLGGGGLLGAHEVGMLRALEAGGIKPDLVVGTSIGAINGSFVAADPAGAAGLLAELWQGEAIAEAFSETLWGRAVRLARSGTHLQAVLASCAVPGLLPPVQVDGEHYFDGGLVDSIPVGRAVALGASTVYVLQVGRIESQLAAPRRPWEVGLVAFEIARRHRFHEEMSQLPHGVTVHVLPAGGNPRSPDLSQLRYRDKTMVTASIERAYAATATYLASQD